MLLKSSLVCKIVQRYNQEIYESNNNNYPFIHQPTINNQKDFFPYIISIVMQAKVNIQGD